MRWEAPRGWSLLTLLLAYGALATLPLIVVGGYLFFRVVQGEHEHLQERVQQVAAAVAGDVDRELQRRATVLGSLAASPRLTQGDFAGFHAQARATVADEKLVVLLHDAISKQQLVNTFVDYGTPLPTTGDPETFDRLLSTKRLEISDLFVSLVSKGPAIDIALPIIKNGKVRYLLKLALTPDHFWQIIAEHSLELRWRVTIVDRRGIIIARTDDHDRFVGRPLPEAQLREMRGGEKIASYNAEGAMTAWATVPSAGWIVRVSAPFHVSRSAFYRSIAITSAAVSALILTLLLGAFFAARISAPLSSVARMAQGLVRQEPIVRPPESYKEADVLAAAFKDAAEKLARLREREQLVVHESGHRIKNILAVVQSLVQQTLRDERLGEARTRHLRRIEALGRAQAALTSSDWAGIPIEQLVASELRPYVGQVVLNGPQVIISGSAAQTLSLLIHELGTNAAKYGALSTAEGRVSVAWAIDGSGEDKTLNFWWRESGGPPVSPASSRGFGSTLLEANVLGGKSLTRYEPDGLIYEFHAPLRGLTPNSGDTGV